MEDKRITHIVVDSGEENDRSSTDLYALRTSLSNRVGANKKIPHIVTAEWVERSWKEKTLLDEERMFYLFVTPAYSPIICLLMRTIGGVLDFGSAELCL